jgi:hypothetical protein
MSKVVALTTLLVLSGSAFADFTSVSYRPGGNSAERNQAEIMARFYGSGTFNTADFTLSGNDFVGQGSYSGITFQRINDFVTGMPASTVGSNLQVRNGNTAGSTDQVWQDGTVYVSLAAKYAGNSQAMGWKSGSTGGSYSNIFNGLIIDPTGVVTSPVPNSFTAAPGSDFRLVRSAAGDGTGDPHDSRVSENTADSLDHMISYEILGLHNGRRTYLLFFEDVNGGGDRDFNDLSMELSVIVPLPPAAWGGISSLACVAGFGFIRRRRLNAR